MSRDELSAADVASAFDRFTRSMNAFKLAVLNATPSIGWFGEELSRIHATTPSEDVD